MPTGPLLTLGRYSLYAPIASGGMATVHLGRLAGPAGFARTVAIKRLHPQFAQDPEFASMFFDEARLAARIRHPNVVPTLDVVAKAGELFLVMEYVEGESLSSLARAVKARGEQIPIPILAAAMSGVLHGLHSAHEARTEHGEPLDIVHRDISPQNIIVGRDGSTRVFDFGVAKAVGRLQTTREGQIKGKLGYMAPELFHGARPTREVDIYGAAVVLWEGITGTRLFAGGHEADVVGRILRGAVPTPAREGETIAPGLAALVKRGLDLDPSRRFPTARDMAFALEAEVPLAIPSTVGTWVEAVAADVLHQRAARVAEIESHSSPLPDDAPVFELPSEVSLRVTEGLPTQTTSISVTTGQPEPALRKRRATTAIVGGLVLVATASGAMYLGLRRPSPVTTDTVPATSAPAVASVAPIEAIEAAAAPQASSASAPSAPPPTPTPVAQATTSAPATAGPNTKATPAPHSSAPRRPSRHNGLFVE